MTDREFWQEVYLMLSEATSESFRGVDASFAQLADVFEHDAKIATIITEVMKKNAPL